MKKKITALLLVTAMIFCTGAFLAGCNEEAAEPEHKTHYDVDGDGKCDKCGVDVEGHKHIYSVLWDNDADFHWHKATCAHTDEVNAKEAHSFKGGVCTVCSALEKGLYHFEAEDAILEDNDAPGNSTMVVELNKKEFTESGKTNGASVSNVGYFGGGAEGQTITWKITSKTEIKSLKITLRLASAVGQWSDRTISEVNLGDEGAPVLTVNGTEVSLADKSLPGLSDLTQDDMQNGVAYHNFADIEITVDFIAGENVIVLTSGSKGCNVDKIMIKTDAELEFTKTDNSSRPASH